MPIPVRHGMSKPRTKGYIAWLSMTQRTTNPNHKQWADYGGRGIDADPRWKDFINFHADMGEPPAGYQLERQDNDKGYWPWNCRWATRTEQQNNRRTTIFLTIAGERLPLRDWARRVGLPYYVLVHRHKMKWPEEEMLSPIDKTRFRVPRQRSATSCH